MMDLPKPTKKQNKNHKNKQQKKTLNNQQQKNP